jgi:thymidine kinase
MDFFENIGIESGKRGSEEVQVVLLGEKDKYEPLCRNCYIKA